MKNKYRMASTWDGSYKKWKSKYDQDAWETVIRNIPLTQSKVSNHTSNVHLDVSTMSGPDNLEERIDELEKTVKMLTKLILEHHDKK